MILQSLGRFTAIMVKEFRQMRRDRLTFAMLIGIPLIQLVLFGYAINTDPRNLPAAAYVADESVFSRSVLAAIENTGYFRIVTRAGSEAEARALLQRGEVQFVIQIPVGFARDLIGGARPAVLVEADATDPAATGNAVAALGRLPAVALMHDLDGALADLAGPEPPFRVIVHARYNPEGITRYNIVPGLTGVVLTMTMVIFTALAVTRETERGTMENLLSMPVRPHEVMLGKIVPYIGAGYVQVGLILLATRYLFGVPIEGSLAVLFAVLILFIAANLAVGFTFSAVARNQLQAVQMSFFFFLPSLLLSGFMFPFRGMPLWAQWLGEALPLTHYLRIVRGILLKGSGLAEAVPDLLALLAFLVAASVIALIRYRRTLD